MGILPTHISRLYQVHHVNLNLHKPMLIFGTTLFGNFNYFNFSVQNGGKPPRISQITAILSFHDFFPTIQYIHRNGDGSVI